MYTIVNPYAFVLRPVAFVVRDWIVRWSMKILYVKMHDHQPEHVIILESSNFEFASNCMLEEEKVAGLPTFLWFKPQSLTLFLYF